MSEEQGAMRSLHRRAAIVVSVAACVVALGTLPAHADAPYHQVHYSAKAGDSSFLGLLPEPTLDITGVGIAFNGHYLRFTIDLPSPDPSPPLLFQQTDYIWRFSYGKPTTQVVVELSQYIHFGVVFPDYLGVTVAGVDTVTPCQTCYGVVDVPHHRAEFFANLDDFNTNVSASAATAAAKPPPVLKPGNVLKLIEADTQAETAGGSAVISGGPWVFVTDTAAAPKGTTFKL